MRLVVPLRAVGRRSPVAFFASLFGALALTFNFAPVYLTVDSAFGGGNVAAWLQHSCLVIATFFVMRLLLRCVGRLTSRANRVLTASVAVALTSQTVAFARIRRVPTTVDLMFASHTQPAAFAFSMSHFLYFGVACIVAICTGSVLLRNQRNVAALISAIAMVVAGVSGALNSGIILLRDLARLRDDMEFEWLEPIFRGLIVTVAVFFCIALSVPAATGIIRRQRIVRVLTTLERVIARSEIKGGSPMNFVQGPPSDKFRNSSADSFGMLSEAVIELRDRQMIGKGPDLTPKETKALTMAERLLSGS
ncbi:hypothetical protein [Microbacterium sp. 2MCAF23]|uniref:hypothetical protein n=1 Tax=Microbacterium sp. 2MCAF23 TaxID=3232985 RepID=UPI003F9992BC